jgi:hypothetical protein
MGSNWFARADTGGKESLGVDAKTILRAEDEYG